MSPRLVGTAAAVAGALALGLAACGAGTGDVAPAGDDTPMARGQPPGGDASGGPGPSPEDGSVPGAPDGGADADASPEAGLDGGPDGACDAAKAARRALVPGTYRPGPATTGPLACVALRRHDGDLVVEAAGTVVEGVDLYGTLVLGRNATNVIVRHSILRGPPSSSNQTSAITGGSSTTGVYDRNGLVLEDVRIDLTGRENWFRNAIEGANFTLRRTEIRRGVDGVGLVSQGGNVMIEASWIHDGYWTSWTAATPEPKPSHADMQTHSDAVQFHRGRRYVLRGNLFGGDRGAGRGTGDDYNNACLMIAQGVDASAANRLEDVVVEKNFFQGGAASINLALSNGNDLRGVTIRDNRFLRGPGFYILRGAGTAPVLANNVFDDTGQPVPIAGN